MILYHGNRTPSMLTNVSAILPENPALRIQVKPDSPFDVKPHEQFLHYFMWECLRPFNEAPMLKLQFTYDDQPQTVTFRMPVMMSNFVHGNQMDAPSFSNAWKQYAVNEVMITLKAQQVVTTAIAIDAINNGLHMAIIIPTDNNPLNVFASGIFHTVTKDKNGNNVTMPCLIRIETKDNLSVFRVTIHSGHKGVSEGLMNSVQYIMQAVPLKKMKSPLNLFRFYLGPRAHLNCQLFQHHNK